jgi:hypothetical protein
LLLNTRNISQLILFAILVPNPGKNQITLNASHIACLALPQGREIKIPVPWYDQL